MQIRSKLWWFLEQQGGRWMLLKAYPKWHYKVLWIRMCCRLAKRLDPRRSRR